jgi:hypothetical protein
MRAVPIAMLTIFQFWFVTAVGAEPKQNPPRSSEDARARKEVLAPIESAELRTMESFPPQYMLHIVSGLPSGCAEFSRIEIKHRSDAVDVTVWNTVPADNTVACTMIYRTDAHNTNLGAHFESGKAYRVYINGEMKASFTAQ